eukprot:1156378-Pelagomonas_calceolata.AAC.7
MHTYAAKRKRKLSQKVKEAAPRNNKVGGRGSRGGKGSNQIKSNQGEARGQIKSNQIKSRGGKGEGTQSDGEGFRLHGCPNLPSEVDEAVLARGRPQLKQIKHL